MKITAICPASCGELIQGWINGGEKLISYGINCYSRVTLQEGFKDNERGYSKSYNMVGKVLQYYGYKEADGKNFALKIDSDIPVGKGMASSTADLAATALATATFLGKEISEAEIASLCIQIEPTDSIVFSNITLLDHLYGRTIQGFGTFPAAKVLLLEGKGTINTIDFRRTNRELSLRKNEALLQKAMVSFEKGIMNTDLKELGKASTISALANQEILYKEGIEKLQEECQRLGAAGINVAHSGTVVGILYSDTDFDVEKFKSVINQRPYMRNYSSIKDYITVAGGAKIHK